VGPYPALQLHETERSTWGQNTFLGRLVIQILEEPTATLVFISAVADFSIVFDYSRTYYNTVRFLSIPALKFPSKFHAYFSIEVSSKSKTELGVNRVRP
jgi:hypothetical protein